MRLDCPCASIIGVLLADWIICRRLCMRPPMVKYLRNVANPIRLLRAAQNKIIVLRTVILTIKSSDLLKKSSGYDQKMADVVIASQQIRIEIRLQVRLKVLTPITGNLVLIGVEQLQIGRASCRERV
mgnify:CR=1 FL=1